MSSSAVFRIKEHVVPCQHIREDFIRTIPEDGGGWRMSVKQYIPLDNLNPKEGDITILGGVANAYPKELYEPLWEDLHEVLSKNGLKIRSIWIADPVNQGASAKLNPELIFDSVNPYDNTRDLLHLVNLFPAEFLHPIIGIGHSIGGSQLAMLSLLHPSLLTSLILLDPISFPPAGTGAASALVKYTLVRKTNWKSQEEAENYHQKALRKWDPRVLTKWNQNAIQESKKSENAGEVELVTGRQMEMTSYLQFPHIQSRAYHDGEDPWVWTYAPLQIDSLLPNISTPTFILGGSTSPTAQAQSLKDWNSRVGSNYLFGKSWNGRERKVDVRVMEGTGHFFPFEKPGEVAARMGVWINQEVGVGSSFRSDAEQLGRWRAMSTNDKEKVTKEWLGKLKSKI